MSITEVVSLLIVSFVFVQFIRWLSGEKITLGEMKRTLAIFEFPHDKTSDPEFLETYSRLLSKFGRAVCKEKEISAKEAEKLPPETEFKSEEVQTAFRELRDWLVSQQTERSKS